MTTIKITFDTRSTPPDGNWNVVNSSGQSYAVGEWVADLVDYDTGLGTGLSLYCTAAWTGNESIGVASDGQGYSDKAWDYPLRVIATAPTATFEIRGLSGGETYTLKAAGFSGNASRDSLYTIDGTAYETTDQNDHTLSTIVSHTDTVSGTSVEVQTTISAVNGSSYGYLSFLDFEYTAAAGLTIDSTDATMQRNTNFQVVCSTPTTAPTTGNTTLTNGNDTLTPSSVTGSDPYTLTFPVGDLTKQVDATGYDWTLTVDAETATTGNIPLVIQSGYTLVDLASPVTTNASLLFGLTGDAPVTGDHLEYDVTSTLDSGVTLSVAATGVWTVTEAVEGDWVTDITVSRRVVQADGTIGAEAVITLSAPTSTASGLTIVTDMVSNIVSNMVN